MFIDPELDHDELFEEDLEGNLTQRVILGAKKVKKLEEEQKQREQEEGEEKEEEEDEQAKETREAVQSITGKTVTEEPTPSTSKEATFVPTDILTENIASGYLPDDDESDAETISSTSTVDYD